MNPLFQGPSWVHRLFLTTVLLLPLLSKDSTGSSSLLRHRLAHGNSPVFFEKNQGQADPSILFMSRARHRSLYLSPTQATWLFQEPNPLPKGHTPRPQTASTDIFKMVLKGADPKCSPEGLDELPGKSNYLLGKDPAQWTTGIPQYGKVRFKDLYPGIDLVYYGSSEDLEYDFLVKAHA